MDEQDKVRDGIRGVRTLELAGTTAICPHNLISGKWPLDSLGCCSFERVLRIGFNDCS